MTQQPTPGFFAKEHSVMYDEKNLKLAPISENLHFLTNLCLKDTPAGARVLCVGAGTGAEMLYFASRYPQWKFTALDPSASMLEVAKQKVHAAGIGAQCDFMQGYIQDVEPSPQFDIVFSMLVGHFVKMPDRLIFYQEMSRRLKPGGFLVNAEISYDLNSETFPKMLPLWAEVQKLMGATEESLAILPEALRAVLTVLSPAEVEETLLKSGVSPVKYFQALMISAWVGRKGL